MDEFAPGLVLIGSDGGDNAFALLPGPGSIRFVRLPFIGMALDAVEILGASFAEFVEALGHTRDA